MCLARQASGPGPCLPSASSMFGCHDETSNSICYGDERSVSVFVQKEEYSYCGCCSLGLIGLDRENRS